jgi:DNA-binding transcriptional LysR family regulator
MMRTGAAPVWRLRHANKAKAEVVMRLTPRLLSDDMSGLKQAAIAGLGIVALRQDLLPSVRVFIDHLAAEFPKAVLT